MTIGVLIIFLAYSVVFVTAEVLFHGFRMNGEITRKFVHICSGGIGLVLPIFIQNHWFILLLAAFFALILFLSNRYHFLKSINDVDRVTIGSTLFPFVLYACYYIHQYHEDLIYYYLPILVLTVSDPLAAIVGKYFNYKPYKVFGNTKTVGGSMAFFSSSMIICFLFLFYFTGLFFLTSLALAVVISLTATFFESISVNGLDNVSVPLCVLGLLMLMLLPTT